MNSRYHVAVVGDLNLDVVVRLPEHTLLDPTENVFLQTPMTVRPAGTAASFALAAVSFFERVYLFGRVGDDEIAAAILKELGHPAITLHVARDHAKPSRIVLIMREGSAGTKGRRVMVAREDVANSRLTDEDLSGLHDGRVSADVLLLDGYSYLAEPARSSVSRAASRVASEGGRVAFDIVPHDLYAYWTLDELLAMIEPAFILVAEVFTLQRFLGLPGEACTDDDVRRLVPQLRESFGSCTLMLRYGVGRIDRSLVVWRDGSTRLRGTGYTDIADPAGFGDRLTAAELVEALDRPEDAW